MPRRRGRPGVMGTMARTAAVVGTANAVNDRHANKQAQAQAQQQAAQPAPAPAPAPAPVAPASGSDMTAKLTELADLKNAGVLTEEEFAAAKAKLLA